MRLPIFKGGLCAAASLVLFASAAQADDLLLVDLTVPDQVTISATEGLSAATVMGSNFTGACTSIASTTAWVPT